MANSEKYDKILDALQELLDKRSIQSISVSDIAMQAGIGKGSIYYYFPSKDAILDALVTRNYEKPLQIAKNLARQTEVSPFTRMAMLFQACRNSSAEFLRLGSALPEEPIYSRASSANPHERAYFHQKYMSHLIAELKPVLTEFIQQGIRNGEIHFDYPAALAEMVLIILSVKIDNTLVPSSPENIEETIRGLICLLEKGTENPPGSLNFLTAF